MPTSSAEGRAAAAHLRVADVDAGYGTVPVIRGVDVTVARGEIVTVVGPNGAGKSTLLKAVIGVLTPSAGTITLGGESIAGLATDRIARKGVGYVPQVRDVFETLTVQENLEMGGYTLPPRRVGERIDRVLELFPALAPMHGRMAGNLSGGERKMLAMARVLMTEPSLLVLDEPTAGLAPQLAHTVLTEHVAALTRADVAVLLVEQRAREALAISDWAYLMVSGEVQLSASGREVLERPDVGAIFLGHAFDTPAPPAR